MTPADTLSDLFTLAIAAEDAALAFYRELARSFSSVPEVSRFWEDMMRDEAFHIQELTDIRNRLSDQQLREPADPSIMKKAKDGLQRFGEKLDLKNVTTLDDAYEIACELEYSEINVVVQAMITKLVPFAVKSDFILSQIREHVSKLDDFSKSISDPERRTAILARHH